MLMDFKQSQKWNLISKNLPARFTLLNSFRNIIFFLLFIAVISVNLTNGIITSASQSIKQSLLWSDTSFGVLNALFNSGKLVGTFLGFLLLNKWNRKCVAIATLILNAVAISIFKFTVNIYLIFPFYVVSGVCFMVINIFVPIWADQFVMNKYKTVFLTFIQLAEALGTVLGAWLNYIIGSNNYQYQFLFESGLWLSVALWLSFFSNIYFSKRVLIVKEVKDVETFNYQPEEDTAKDKKSVASSSSLFRIRQSNESTFEVDFLSIVWRIWTNKVFIFSVISRMIMLTVQTSFVFWWIDYMRNVLKITGESTMVISFALICLSGPIGGWITSIIVSLSIGNYENKHSALIVFIFYLIAAVIANWIPRIQPTNFYVFIGSSMLYWMLCSSSLPIIQGISLSSVTQSVKGTAYSISNLIIQLFGVIPSTFWYGFINEQYKADKGSFAMVIIMWYLLLGLVFSFLTLVFKYLLNTGSKNNIFSNVELKDEIENKEIEASSMKIDESYNKEGSSSDKEMKIRNGSEGLDDSR